MVTGHNNNGFQMDGTLVGCWGHIIQHSQTYHLKLRFVLAEAKDPFFTLETDKAS